MRRSPFFQATRPGRGDRTPGVDANRRGSDGRTAPASHAPAAVASAVPQADWRPLQGMGPRPARADPGQGPPRETASAIACGRPARHSGSCASQRFPSHRERRCRPERRRPPPRAPCSKTKPSRPRKPNATCRLIVNAAGRPGCFGGESSPAASHWRRQTTASGEKGHPSNRLVTYQTLMISACPPCDV